MALFPDLNNCTVAVIGLGYVGLPLALAFATTGRCVRSGIPLSRQVIGFDISDQRLSELRRGIDRTNETNAEELLSAQRLELTSDPERLMDADVFVITVLTRQFRQAPRSDSVRESQCCGWPGTAATCKYPAAL